MAYEERRVSVLGLLAAILLVYGLLVLVAGAGMLISLLLK